MRIEEVAQRQMRLDHAPKKTRVRHEQDKNKERVRAMIDRASPEQVRDIIRILEKCC